MSLKDEFAALFGLKQAEAIELAAYEHGNGINNENMGGDHFRWSILVCIGYGCMEDERFRKHHGVEVPWKQLKAWILANAQVMREHKGSVDYLGLLAGKYDWLKD